MTRHIVALFVCAAAVCPWASAKAFVHPVPYLTHQDQQLHIDDIGLYGAPLSSSSIPHVAAPASSIALAASSITLEEAIQLALKHFPPLEMERLELRVAQASIRQARLIPNPELSFEMEQDKQGAFSTSGVAETFWGISQQIEIGGKRSGRIRMEEAGAQASESRLAARTLEVVREVSIRFYHLLANQRRLQLSDSLLATAEQFHATVSQRQRAGKVSELEERRARILLTTARVQHEEARRMVLSARIDLQAMWGDEPQPINRADGALDQVVSVPPLNWMMSRLDDHPELLTLRLREEEARFRHAWERANAVPDPELSLGVRKDRELGIAGFVIGTRIALPLFHRNQGAIARSSIKVSQAGTRLEAARLQLISQLRAGYADVTAARNEADLLGETAIADALANLEALVTGYENGKFDLLSVLDAQRALFEISDLHINALERFHTRRLHVERLIGMPFASYQAEEN